MADRMTTFRTTPRTLVRAGATAALLALAIGTSWTGPSLAMAQPAAPSGSSAAPAGMQTIRGTTAPKDRRKLRFDIRGIVAESPKKKGDPVKPGEVLVRLDDAEQRATLKAREIDADVALSVAEAEAEKKVADLTLQNTEKSFQNNAANEIEVETDRAKAEIAKIKVDLAKRQGTISAAQADAQRALVNRMSMKVPGDMTPGALFLVDVFVKAGEGVEESRDVAEVIDVSQLYIDVRLADIGQVRQLKVGQTLRVQFAGESRWRDAKINFIAPEGDAKAGTLPFRLELENAEKRQPGEDILVEVPTGPSGVAAGR